MTTSEFDHPPVCGWRNSSMSWAIVSVKISAGRECDMEEDEEKLKFLNEIDRIIETEDSGKTDEAKKQREALSKQLEAELEEQ